MTERIEARDSETKEWSKRRTEVWGAGHTNGEELVAALGELIQPSGDPDTTYLRYLYCLGVAQAFTNRARELGETNFGSALQEAQRKGRVDH